MLKLILEFGPIVVFLLTYKYSNIMLATAIMVATTTLCLGLSYLIDKRLSVPLMLSGGILILMGLMTLLKGDSAYIKMKPTIVYTIFAFTLYIGAIYDKPFVKSVFGTVVEMDNDKWLILSKRFGLYFVVMAIVNEYVWRQYSENFWVNFKVFGALPLSGLFIATQFPFINKHNKKDLTREDLFKKK